MAIAFRAGLVLLALGVIGLTAYAYVGDLSPDRRDATLPVTLNVK